ncbi:zinc-binding alcohol dehydrogenase family protein [Rhodococcoides fascians]|uniref:zinc-binding alcohol dehydrogenase family protein n=1 Tax=Rhodococcoides fascians TaxID=1828 RepID=UPI0009B8C53D|nr:zinc-binding alcohol dehydrogenase family protein [Rhodococcus fascians]
MSSDSTNALGSATGRIWHTTVPGPVDGDCLEMTVARRPQPGRGELLVDVEACGVCRTDLHVAEGDLPVHRPHVIPGHEVVGRVAEIGPATASDFQVGQLVGIPWLRYTCGTCPHCRTGHENLCSESRYTGWDEHGGFADWTTVPADYALALPDGYTTTELAPLLCAGIIGYRALSRADLPPSGKLGLYGFGASAHIVGQLAHSEGTIVHVMTRGSSARELALSLGLESAQDTYDSPPEKLDAAIVFAPVGDIVPAALAALAPGGTLVLAGIHMSDVPVLNYEQHLFHEKTILSIEANTREDARAFLERCGDTHLEVTTTRYDFEQVPVALRDLKHGRFAGAGVIVM